MLPNPARQLPEPKHARAAFVHIGKQIQSRQTWFKCHVCGGWE